MTSSTEGRTRKRTNKHGLVTSSVNKKLIDIKNNTTQYRPSELARDLVKLAFSIDSQTTVNTAQALQVERLKCG